MTTRRGSRSGIGYDSHRFAPGGPLLLGGVRIPADVHLEGHSDADAICHAVIDALLGAAALGDVGTQFPDSEAANKGRDSTEMLQIVGKRIQDEGWYVSNIDVTVIAESPRIGAHRAAMAERIAAVLGIAAAQISVKGKTNEGMGWIGRREGLACIAVASIEPADVASGHARK